MIIPAPQTLVVTTLLLVSIAVTLPRARAGTASPSTALPSSPNDYEIVTSSDESRRRPGDLADHDMIVSTTDPAKRAPLAHAGDACDGEYEFSPDARFMYANYHVASRLSAGELFVHQGGLKFTALDQQKKFSDLAWDFYSKQNMTRRINFEEADAKLIDFTAWSADGGRLLVSLSGGMRHREGIDSWYVYWNTQTRDFELTDYLRALNRDAARRWSDDKFRDNSPLAACAEPFAGGTPTETGAKKSYDAADKRLNAVYTIRLAKLGSKERKIARDEQRKWLTRRDDGAKVYASFGGDPTEKEVRRWQYLSGVTQQRVHELDPESTDDTEAEQPVDEAPGKNSAAAPSRKVSIKCPSPNGRYALQITEPVADGDNQSAVDMIEKPSGDRALDLGYANSNRAEETVLVWSEDSKRVAYATQQSKTGETSVYFWNGSSFEEGSLPENLPDPKIAFGRGGEGDVKNYGGATMPLRWLKSGDLELSTDLTMLSRKDGRSYTGIVRFTLAFDAKHHATVHHVEKTKTQIDQ